MGVTAARAGKAVEEVMTAREGKSSGTPAGRGESHRGRAQPVSVGKVVTGPVFFISALLILAFVALTAFYVDQAAAVFSAVQGWIVDTVGWFYALAVAIFLVFVVGLAATRFGDTKLGPDDSEPEFGFLSWFAMLFSAGMGIGLMFYGVAEPLLHYADPPVGAGNTPEAARQALNLSLFHWGLHAWAIYIVIGLAIAYFAFRHNLPLSIRSALYPLIGDRIYGRIGHAVDIFAVIGTMFGVATSLGLGVLQVNAGLAVLFGVGEGPSVQIMLIAFITALATLSVASGLGRGIRRLSELNILLALFLLVFVLVAGPTGFLAQAAVQNAGTYLGSLVSRTFNLYAYESSDWISGWTLFYWGWWISWAPFVGMFIARVSRGRTIREFVAGVLGVPAVLTLLWFTAFGNSAIAFDIAGGGVLTDAVQDSVPSALFLFFEQLPFSYVISLVATLLVMTFFVTSSDSGSLVIDMITAGGVPNPPLATRVFWALAEGVVAAVLLLAGGLSALQTAAIASGFPFAVIMLFVCYGLYKGLKNDAGLAAVRPKAKAPAMPLAGTIPWQQRLKHILTYPTRRQAEAFLTGTVTPALEKVAAEIREAGGFEAEVHTEEDRIALAVSHGAQTDFLYAVEIHGYRRPSFGFTDFDDREEEGALYYRAEVHLLEGPQHYDIVGFTESQVIADVLAKYDIHMNLLHLAADPNLAFDTAAE